MDDKILIALVAASATLLGVIISQAITFLISHINRKHERKVLLRNKYEELMFYFSDSFGWVVQVNNAQSKEELFALSQSPEARKVLSLSLLYFKDLVPDANKYVFAMQEYYNFTVSAFNSAIPHSAGAQALIHEEGNQLIQVLLKTKVSLENSIVNKAPVHSQA